MVFGGHHHNHSFVFKGFILVMDTADPRNTGPEVGCLSIHTKGRFRVASQPISMFFGHCEEIDETGEPREQAKLQTDSNPSSGSNQEPWSFNHLKMQSSLVM